MTGTPATSEYVRFRVGADQGAAERFAALEGLFAVLAAFKAEQFEPIDEDDEDYDEDAEFRLADAVWLGLFPESVRANFEIDEPELIREVWRTSSIVLTPTSQTSGLRWGVFGVLESLTNAEYLLLGCERLEGGLAQWRFDAMAYPYGGVGSMVGLIEGFGFEVVEIHDGTGVWTP